MLIAKVANLHEIKLGFVSCQPTLQLSTLLSPFVLLHLRIQHLQPSYVGVYSASQDQPAILARYIQKQMVVAVKILPSKTASACTVKLDKNARTDAQQ